LEKSIIMANNSDLDSDIPEDVKEKLSNFHKALSELEETLEPFIDTPMEIIQYKVR
jgi:hypothetical protein